MVSVEDVDDPSPDFNLELTEHVGKVQVTSAEDFSLVQNLAIDVDYTWIDPKDPKGGSTSRSQRYYTNDEGFALFVAPFDTYFQFKKGDKSLMFFHFEDSKKINRIKSDKIEENTFTIRHAGWQVAYECNTSYAKAEVYNDDEESEVPAFL